MNGDSSTAERRAHKDKSGAGYRKSRSGVQGRLEAQSRCILEKDLDRGRKTDATQKACVSIWRRRKSCPAYSKEHPSWWWNVVSPPVDMSRLRLMRVHPKHGIDIHNSVERYDALPGLETVRSMISINASLELFKNGKMKIRCLATMFTLYRRTQESELHDDAPQLALIMIPTTQSNEGIFFSSGTGQIHITNVFMVILLYFVHLHAWLRKLQ
ncbi:hypothetical protein Zmor_020838 [Zophobas morio]|uniref:Uncharacterized protein n=1 Tax=Zophobas morio TaxID=2755281 RepID=A0AA38I6L8_9CUCU|nr:hypothetical protein Zmor_020838 [Zophobas morio]